MKKVFIIFAIIFIATTQVYAIGIGVQGNYYLNFQELPDNYDEQKPPAFGFSLLISPNRQLNLAGCYYFSETNHLFGITADYHPKAFTFKLAGSGMTLTSNPSAWWLNFGFGLGGFLNLWVTDLDKNNAIDDIEFSAGARIPIGLSLNLANGIFEIFTSIAPSVGIRFGEATPFADWFFPVAVGLRIWIE